MLRVLSRKTLLSYPRADTITGTHASNRARAGGSVQRGRTSNASPGSGQQGRQ
jgi:hypothetical protein